MERKAKFKLLANESMPEFSNLLKNKVQQSPVQSKILANESMHEFSNAVKKKIEQKQNVHDSFLSLQSSDAYSAPKDQKLPQLHGSPCQPVKEKTNRRVAINNSVIFSIVSIKKSDINSSPPLAGTAAPACRAVFRRTHHDHSREPGPQFEKMFSVDCQDIPKRELLPMHGNKNPFICPVTFCKNIIPVSDLIKHFKLNHIRVPIVPVNAGACMNLFWEAKVDQFGTSQCLMLLLTTGKFKEFGYGQFKDSLPVTIMTTKVKFLELADIEYDREEFKHFYMIWVNAMTPSVEPVYYTLTAWGGTDDAPVHIVSTTQLYSIREDQSPKNIYRSGKLMILTSEQINKLSHNNQEMVKLQVVVH